MKNWAAEAKAIIRRHGTVILVTLGRSKGSTPRGPGTKMLVGRDETSGTIGGGNLEYLVTEQARKMLDSAGVNLRYQHFALGPLLGQCCGGATNVLFEKLNPEHLPLLDQVIEVVENKRPYGLISVTKGNEVKKHFVTAAPGDNDDEISEWHRNDALPLYMFGAGHVGKAMALVLGRLNFEVTWIDDRKNQFPEIVADNVTKILSGDPVSHVSLAPAGSIFLIFTYSHNLDYNITDAVLKRDDFLYCGLIGSQTKRTRFKKYFLKSGGPADQLKKLTCPVGLCAITGKSPDIIAIAVAAELLSLPYIEQEGPQ
ncbi:MAG: xanthine dehydrogenase accessory protein XdhC [Alphaproteobacteria bacterium]|nr:MAG: xanthine dehydrogenase accessory protein XdhC [Alphaproteobacteria bacterium]